MSERKISKSNNNKIWVKNVKSPNLILYVLKLYDYIVYYDHNAVLYIKQKKLYPENGLCCCGLLYKSYALYKII